jgi:hypothetical protein
MQLGNEEGEGTRDLELVPIRIRKVLAGNRDLGEGGNFLFGARQV